MAHDAGRSCDSSSASSSAQGGPRRSGGFLGDEGCSSSSGSVSSGSSGSSFSNDSGGPFRGRGRQAPAKSRGRGGARGSFGLPAWVRTISDSILVVRGGGIVPAGKLFRTSTLPAVLSPPSPRGDERPATRGGLSRSQARLIIPRTISEYFECCRYARSHTEGLLPILVDDNKDAVNLQDLVKAYSAGMLGGRVFPPGPSDKQSDAQDNSRGNNPPKPIPVSELRVGALMEGKIVRITRIGYLVDVGATALGLLKRKDCVGVPRELLRRGEVLSNLYVLNVDGNKGRFSLRVDGVDGSSFQELVYIEVLQRVAGWATVELPPAMLEYAAQMSMRGPNDSWKSASSKSVRGSARRGRGRGRGRLRGSASLPLNGAKGGAARSWVPCTAVRSASSIGVSSSSASVSTGAVVTPKAGRNSARRGRGRGGLTWRPVNKAVAETGETFSP